MLFVFLKFLKKLFFRKSRIWFKYFIFIKPIKKNIFNYLRAPYKNKLSRNQLYTPRYKFSVTIKIYQGTKYEHDSPDPYKNIINFFKKNLLCLESNIIYLNKIKISYKAFLKNYCNHNKLYKYN
jgi:hypothetical protein